MKHIAALALVIASALLPQVASAQEKDGLGPVFAASEGWINGPASPASLRDKVVVVDVFTFGCYNCKNVLPNLRAINKQHAADVAVVGIHSPETSYEKNRTNVVDNLRAQGITWPVALDNSFALWNAYGVTAWPTQLFFDRKGHLRKTIVGDSQDDAVNAEIKELVAEK